MNLKKIVGVAAIALTATVVLTACSSDHTVAEAKSLRYSVVMTKAATLTQDPKFSYVNSEGDLQKLSHCGRKNFFAPRVCSTKDGLIAFSYETAKHGRIVDTSITVDGKQIKLDCSYDGDDFWSDQQICVPKENR